MVTTDKFQNYSNINYTITSQNDYNGARRQWKGPARGRKTALMSLLKIIQAGVETVERDRPKTDSILMISFKCILAVQSRLLCRFFLADSPLQTCPHALVSSTHNVIGARLSSARARTTISSPHVFSYPAYARKRGSICNPAHFEPALLK